MQALQPNGTALSCHARSEAREVASGLIRHVKAIQESADLRVRLWMRVWVFSPGLQHFSFNIFLPMFFVRCETKRRSGLMLFALSRWSLWPRLPQRGLRSATVTRRGLWSTIVTSTPRVLLLCRVRARWRKCRSPCLETLIRMSSASLPILRLGSPRNIPSVLENGVRH